MLKPILRFDNYLDETNTMSIRIKGIRYGQHDDDVKTWMMFGGDNEQCSTLKEMEWNKRMDKLVTEF